MMKLLFSALCFMFVGCGTTTKTTSPPAVPPKVVQYPDWVTRGVAPTVILSGVGSASGIKNLELAESTARNRARGEVVRQLEDAFAARFRSRYPTPVDPPWPTETNPVEEQVKTCAANLLAKVEDEQIWTHPIDGTIYARASLSSDHVFGMKVCIDNEQKRKLWWRMFGDVVGGTP